MAGTAAVSREKFLETAEDDDKSLFVDLIRRHENKADSFDVNELLPTLSQKQMSDLWRHLQIKATTTLFSFDTQGSENEQAEELQEAAMFLHCVLTVAMAAIAPVEATVPKELFETALVLHGILPTLPDQQDKLKNSISKLCESWWQKGLTGRTDLAVETFIYLLQRSLDHKASGADVQRVWKLREVLRSIDLDNTSADVLKNNLLAAYFSPMYLKVDEGIKFLAFVFDINVNFIDQIHNTIRNHLPVSSKNGQVAYGKIYFKAWRVASGNVLEKIEKCCIQDLMHKAMLARRSGSSALFFTISRVLNQIHTQNKQRGVEEMLIRLYEPILWRYLKVANSNVRANAADLLFDAFPLQDQEADIFRRDSLMQRQFDTFSQLLQDSCPAVRSLAAHKVCQIIQVYWELIPSQTIKAFIGKLVQDLAWDGSSTDVRAAVVKGLTILLDNHLAHPLMKVILPEMTNLFHDTGEKVRTAFCDLLLKVKQLHTIKFWSVVPLDHIMARLEVDTPAVSRRLVTLLFSSCFPEDKSSEEMLARCIDMIEKYPGAVRKFYQYGVKHMSFSTAVKFIVLICKAVRHAVLKAAKKQARQNGAARKQAQNAAIPDDILESFNEDKENTQEVEEDDEEAEEEEDEEDELLTVNKTEVIVGLLETAVILWSANAHVLKRQVNEKVLKELQKRYSQALPEFFKVFQDSRIVSALIILAGFLPPATIPTFSRSTLSKLKHMKMEDKAEDYGNIIESMCKWGRVDDIQEFISEWIAVGLKVEETPSASKSRKKGRVMFAEPVDPQPLLALEYTQYLMQHKMCRETLLGSNRDTMEQLAGDMKAVLRHIEKRLASVEPLSDFATDEFLLQLFETYLKTEVLLHDVNSAQSNAIRKMEELLTWADKVLVTPLKKSAPNKPQKKSRKLMRTADTTLLATPSDGPDSYDGSSQTMIMSETMMSQTMLSETMMSQTMYGQKRGAGDVGESAKLASKFLECMLNVVSEMLLVGTGDVLLCSALADFSLRLVQVDEAIDLLPQIFKVVYQVTQLTSTLDGKGHEEKKAAIEQEAVSVLLNRTLPLLAKVVRTKPATAETLLPLVKSPLTEILLSFYRRHLPEAEVSQEVMGQIMAAVVAEVIQHVKKDNQFEACSSLTSLPTLSAFLLTTLHRSPALLGLFLSELHKCVKSEAIEDMEGWFAVAHVVNAVTLTKVKLEASTHLKDCISALNEQLAKYTIDADIPESSPIREMHTNAKTMVADCMTKLNMESSVIAANG